MDEVSGKKISVIGAERSGVAVARLLQKKKAKVFVSDAGNNERTVRNIDELQAIGIGTEHGGHSEKVYDSSLMVISPGVPGDAPVVVEAQRRGIKVVAEVEVASWFCRGPVIAITGSNGKTTTTSLLGRMFSDAKKKYVVAGNIGTAFSSVVLDADQETTVVLEISSFQLDFIETFHPAVAVILNITQNHMDRYGNSMERYAASKARIFMNQTKNDHLIINADDKWSNAVVAPFNGSLLSFSSRHPVEAGAFTRNEEMITKIHGEEHSIVNESEISIKGEHNLQNAMAATLAAQLGGVTPAYLKSTLRNFKGVEHRQEFVRELNGVRFINDSKATTVEAVGMALKSFDQPIVLILGGKDKGNDYSTIFDIVKKKVKAIVATGQSAGKVSDNFSGIVMVKKIDTAGSDIPNLVSMKKTVETARGLADKGDIVLLSPACASFDWFNDYEERGRVFKKLVNELT